MTEPAEVGSEKSGFRRQKYGLLMAALAAVAVLACAKKMMPPSPDRFPPHLSEVVTRTRSQVGLVFDEGIDGAKLVPDSFKLVGSAGETIALRGASLGRGSDEVQLWTPTQEPKLYEVRGIVWDRAGNPARFRARFHGSTKRDTIAPRILRVDPSPGSAGQKRGVAIRVMFSEAIDTSGTLDCTFVPAEYDTQFKRSWTEDWQTLSFVRRESLPAGAIVYFLVQRGAKDLEGNRVRGPAFTYFTSDSAFDALPVKGRATWHDGPLGTGTVLFHTLGTAHAETVSSERTEGLAPVLPDGSFSTKVRKGDYEVVAVADTNGDGLSDLSSPVVKFNTDTESLNLVLGPESLPRPINAYRR